MYRTRSPWFWPLFRLPFGGKIEVTDEGISFPDSAKHRSWREGDSLSVKQSLLGRIRLISADGTKRRTIGLTWPWNTATVARELAQYREAGLHRLLDELADELRTTGQAIASTLTRRYVPHRTLERWLNVALKARPLLSRLDAEWMRPDLRPFLTALANVATGGHAAIDAANSTFIAQEKSRLAALPQYATLTSEQLDAILTLEDATLVVASAGSGKTRVIETRVRYLVDECAVPQHQILVLAFNRTVAAEVGARLGVSGLPQVAVKTFHAMGLKIRSDVEGRAVGLSPLADPESPAPLVTFVQGVLTETLRDPTDTDVSTFLTTYLQPPAFEGDLDATASTSSRPSSSSIRCPSSTSGSTRTAPGGTDPTSHSPPRASRTPSASSSTSGPTAPPTHGPTSTASAISGRGSGRRRSMPSSGHSSSHCTTTISPSAASTASTRSWRACSGAQLFLRIFARVLSAYEHELTANGETDFEDMIGRSARAVANGDWRSPFTHVLVDEFQDIYRFAGSQIRIMTDFGHYFGHHRRLPLSLTHRFSAALADASGWFVLKNSGQIRKTVRGRPYDVERPITLVRTDATASAAGLRRAIELVRATHGRPAGERASCSSGATGTMNRRPWPISSATTPSWSSPSAPFTAPREPWSMPRCSSSSGPSDSSSCSRASSSPMSCNNPTRYASCAPITLLSPTTLHRLPASPATVALCAQNSR